MLPTFRREFLTSTKASKNFLIDKFCLQDEFRPCQVKNISHHNGALNSAGIAKAQNLIRF